MLPASAGKAADNAGNAGYAGNSPKQSCLWLNHFQQAAIRLQVIDFSGLNKGKNLAQTAQENRQTK